MRISDWSSDVCSSDLSWRASLPDSELRSPAPRSFRSRIDREAGEKKGAGIRGVGALKDDSLRGGNDRASMPRRACLGARLRQAAANLPRGCLVPECRNAPYRPGRWAEARKTVVSGK